MHLRSLTLVLATAALGPATARAALVLYEPFSYGDAAVALNEVDGTATGLDGTTYSTAGTTEYVPGGLSFSNLQVAGGNARLGYHASEVRNATRGLDFEVSSGTLFGSMLYTSGGAANNGVSTLLFTTLSSHNDNVARLDIAANEYDSPSGAQNFAGVRTFGQSTKATGTQMAGDQSETYLILFQVSDVGITSGTQNVSAWVLTQSQFDNFKPGGLTAAELDAAPTGETATDVLQRVTHTNTGDSGYFSLNDSHFIRLFSYRGSGSFDEIRLGTSSLDEVTPVPEPAAAVVAAGLLPLLMRPRRC